MKIHYFQRYHGKENVATANTMLLLSRLYSFSSDKFFNFLKSEFFSDSFDPEISINLQVKSTDSVPDAIISQESFKVVVETKLYDWFTEEQLMNHLKAFGDEKYKVLLSLAPESMSATKKAAFESGLAKYNAGRPTPVIHINTTFETLVNAIRAHLDARDYEMHDVLDDYMDYCCTDGLIDINARKRMRVQLAGQTFEFNMRTNLYYDDASRGFSPHDILGLYKNKSVRAIGKVVARITAIETSNGMKYNAEFGDLTDARKALIAEAIADGLSHGYDLKATEHRYFFVEQFISTDYQKSTPRAPMGTKFFDLSEVLGMEDLPEIKEIARLLCDKTWS